MNDTLLVVGGGPAAHATASAYRDNGGEDDVLMISADDHSPYNRPPLSKEYLRGDGDSDDLPLAEPGYYEVRGIDVRLRERVVDLRPTDHKATLSTGEQVSYRKCVLATGSTPNSLPVPGSEHEAIVRLRSFRDALRLREIAAKSGSAVVIGSGFIGCEAAVSLARRGLAVTLVSDETLPQQGRLGEYAGRRLAGWLASEKVLLRLGETVTRIEDGHRVHLDGGSPAEAELVLLAVGVSADVDLAHDAGLRVENGRIRTDSAMRTSADDVLAAGDVALAYNAGAARPLAVEHWGEALRMGEIAGATAAGKSDRWRQAPGFWSTIGDRTVKYVAWGDGFDKARPVPGEGTAFTVWYGKDGICVGALTYQDDDAYEQAQKLVESRSPLPD